MNKQVARTCDKKMVEPLEKRMKAISAKGQLYRGVDPELILQFDKFIKGVQLNQSNNTK